MKSEKPRYGRTFLREWRLAKPMTLEEAAHHVGITHGQLSKIERGLQPYNQELLENLALLYGSDPALLISQDPSASAGIVTLLSRADFAQTRQITALAEAIVGYEGEEQKPKN